MMKSAFHHQAVRGLVLFLAIVGPAWAGSFQVTPVRATISAGHPVSALTVRNTGTAAAIIQLEAMTWSQPSGKDVYASATDILATPPIFTLAVGGSQVIRIGSRRPPDATSERAYRLFLREVPPPPQPGFKGLRMALQISLPLFVVPDAVIAPDLHWQAALAPPGKLRLSVVNHGSAHIRLIGFRLIDEGNRRPLAIPDQAVYVLAGATHEWLIDAGSGVADGSALHLTAQTDTEALQADVTVSGR